MSHAVSQLTAVMVPAAHLDGRRPRSVTEIHRILRRMQIATVMFTLAAEWSTSATAEMNPASLENVRRRWSWICSSTARARSLARMRAELPVHDTGRPATVHDRCDVHGMRHARGSGRGTPPARIAAVQSHTASRTAAATGVASIAIIVAGVGGSGSGRQLSGARPRKRLVAQCGPSPQG